MRKPIITILCSVSDNETASEYRLPHSYVDAISKCGGIPILLPYTLDREMIGSYVDIADGFLFTGGNDVDPALYNEAVSPSCGEIERARDDFEIAIANAAFSTKKPIMGICRGIQLLNVALGGTLYQDIDSECDGCIQHRQSEPNDSPSHEVTIIEGTPLYTLIGEKKMTANSFHHQALKKLGYGLRAMAYASDKTVEAVYSTEYPYLYAYQWHPERLFRSSDGNRKLFSDFISACKNKLI